jgi:hypothetical protein
MPRLVPGWPTQGRSLVAALVSSGVRQPKIILLIIHHFFANFSTTG